MRIWLLCISIFFFCYLTTAQNSALQSVKGLPSDEVYDLFADSKGFIWAAHSLGISRYDGMNFKDFNHPLATGAGITDITEDKQGRIWCHNFNGQVFYIENEQMYLLEAYKYKEEAFYPRLMVLNDELLVTSQKGLFVLNTSTFKSKYILSKTNSNKAGSISIVDGKAYITNGDLFYRYETSGYLKNLKINESELKKKQLIISGFQLQPLVTNDAIYSKYNQLITIKLTIRDEEIKLSEIIESKNFINTITKNGNDIWINTKTESSNFSKSTFINLNLSDVITDKYGNLWLSSLVSGLIIRYKNIFWEEFKFNGLNKDDQVCSNVINNKLLIYGTLRGNIKLKSNASDKTYSIELPKIVGSIEKMYALNDSEILVTPSTGIYIFNIRSKTMLAINSSLLSIKGFLNTKLGLFIAHTNCITKHKSFKVFEKSPESGKIIYTKRCSSIALNKSTEKILISFSNGLHELINDSTFLPVLYNNEVISASSLLSIGDKTYATTFNNGLFIIDKNGIRRKSIADGLLSNKIFKLKYINNQLFILEQNNIQILDINSEKIIKTIALPTEKSSVVYDLWQEDSLVYLSSNKGLYKLDINKINTIIIPNNYILSITSDTSVISPNKPVQLPYSQNTIQFKVISPSFIYPEYTFFKYRILGGNDTTWQQTTTNESNISFAALKPGDYTFEAYAVNFQNSRGKTLSYQFSILKPWWQQWWFIGIILFCAGLILYYSIKLRIKAIDKKNNELVEKIALTSELRKSQLSTIVAQMNPHFIFNTLNTIQGLIYKNDKNSSTKYIGKFSELVRDILKNSNQQEISLEEELSHLSTYLELEKMRFEDDLNIILTVDEALDKNNIMLPPILIQPYIENAIFHGLFHKKGQKNLAIQFCQSLKDNYLEIIIDDNGIGRALSQQLNTQRRKHESFAISAIERRINLLNQSLNRKIEIAIIDKVDSLKNAIGTKVTISIPINGF